MVDGLLLINKERGPTSHDVVAALRRALGQKRIGHTGTLDPAATGLLVILLGRATKLASWLIEDSKEYDGTIRLGVETDTLDAQGEVVRTQNCPVNQAQIKAAARSLTGILRQKPPDYSAIKVDGVPAYKIARRGGRLSLEAREVMIEKFDVEVKEEGDYPLVSFQVSCSSGTYIRSLAADFGAFLRCPAHLESLRRTSVGKFTLAESVALESFSGVERRGWEQMVMPMREAVDLPEVFVDEAEMSDLLGGGRTKAAVFTRSGGGARTVKIIRKATGQLAGIGRIAGDTRAGSVSVKPFKVLMDREELDV